MITAMGIWIKNLIFLMLFAAFMELLLPDGKMKKFLHMVMGMLLLLAVLKPVAVFMAGDFSWTDIPVFSASLKSGRTDFAEGEIKRRRLTYSVYEKELSAQIKKVLETMPEVGEVGVKISVDEGENIGDVDMVKSVVINAKPTKNGKKIRVELGNESDEMALPETVKEKIRQRIHDLYQIPLSKISVG